MNLAEYFWLVLQASLFATTGMGNLPYLHRELLARHWATDRQFADALVIGRISPGPTGLWVVSLSVMVGGARAALASVAAIVLPPLLVLLVDRIRGQMEGIPPVEGFIRGLGLAVVGVSLTVLWDIARSLALGWTGLATLALAALLAASGRVPIFAILVAAALAGIALR